jgi:endonuclease YncB( thermonuclease family)
VDAPELAHWGREAQPYSKEAQDWLIEQILNKRVRAYIYRRDQYDRVVAMVRFRKSVFRKDLGLEMLKNGLATVYEAKVGAEFGKYEQAYRKAQEKAVQDKVGMWSKPSWLGRIRGETAQKLESPREYKTRMAAADKNKKK